MASSSSSFTSFVTQDELLLQGMPAPEARRQAVRHNRAIAFALRAMESLKFLLIAAAAIPMILVVVVFLLSYLSGTGQLLGLFLSNISEHLSDPCDQPLGAALSAYWSSIGFVAACIITCGIAGKCCERLLNHCCEAWWPCFKYVVVLPICIFWLIWPFATFWLYLCVRNCSPPLKNQASFILLFYFLGIVAVIFYTIWPLLLPLLYRLNVLSDPGNATRTLERVEFQPNKFSDDTADCYPAVCSICLDNFAQGQGIVAAPCSGGRHIFHEPCLADWMRMSQTCPLCRTSLANRETLTDSTDVQV